MRVVLNKFFLTYKTAAVSTARQMPSFQDQDSSFGAAVNRFALIDRLHRMNEKIYGGRNVSMELRLQKANAKLYGDISLELPHVAFLCGRSW